MHDVPVGVGSLGRNDLHAQLLLILQRVWSGSLCQLSPTWEWASTVSRQMVLNRALCHRPYWTSWHLIYHWSYLCSTIRPTNKYCTYFVFCILNSYALYCHFAFYCHFCILPAFVLDLLVTWPLSTYLHLYLFSSACMILSSFTADEATVA